MTRRLYCNECGKSLSWESCIPATWMGRRVCLCKGCAYSVAPELAPRLNPGPSLEALRAGVRIKKRYPRMDVRVRNPISLYQKFHGNPPARRRKINVPLPKKGTVLTVLGKMPEIRYTPYSPSQYAGTTFRHRWGDNGRVMLPGKPLLATDGTDFYVIKDKQSKARFTSRGIIG